MTNKCFLTTSSALEISSAQSLGATARQMNKNDGPIREPPLFAPSGDFEEPVANKCRHDGVHRSSSSGGSLDPTNHGSNRSENRLQLPKSDRESLWETESLSSLGTLVSHGDSGSSHVKSGKATPCYPPLQEILLKDDGVDRSTNSTPQQKALTARSTRREEPDSTPSSISNVTSMSPCRGWHPSSSLDPSRPMKHQHQLHTRALIEISPGADAYLIGAQETMEALSSDRILSCSCIICSTWVAFKDEASMVLCPVCHSITPVGALYDDECLVVGLGVQLE